MSTENTTPQTAEKKAITLEEMAKIMSSLRTAMTEFGKYANTFSPDERNRKIGLGVRNYGFVETALNSAEMNQKFMPSYLDVTEFGEVRTDMERKRDLLGLIRQFEQQVADSMLSSSDTAYHYALLYYNSLKEANKQKIDGAETEFKVLESYFKKHRPSHNGEPTEKEIERDLHALLHGTKDGEIIIKNQRPQTSGGAHEVIDNTHRDHDAAKATISENDND